MIDFEEKADDLCWHLDIHPTKWRINLIKQYLQDAFDEGADYGYDNSPRDFEVKRLNKN